MSLNPTQKKLLAELAKLRFAARNWVRVNRMTRDNITVLERKRGLAKLFGAEEAERDAVERLQMLHEWLTECRFGLIEIGRYFISSLSREINEHLPREAWLEALSVNRSEWESDDMREHGYSPLNVVSVLRLENSATKDDGTQSRPLAWCCQMALMNAMQTSSKLDRAVHEATNEFFGGLFGEYRGRSPLERMGIPASMIQGGEG